MSPFGTDKRSAYRDGLEPGCGRHRHIETKLICKNCRKLRSVYNIPFSILKMFTTESHID